VNISKRLRIPGVLIISLFLLVPFSVYAQGFDSTQIGKEYPYVFPILGKKAYTRGYKLPKPHGIMLNTFFNKQGIILENFRMAFTQGDEEPDFDFYQPLADLIVFGPSRGKISTLNLRVDTWILPFFAIGGYYGKVDGEQSVTLTAPIEIESITDIEGQYWGANFLVVAPVGPLNLAADYSVSWTTNVRLDAPVKVDVVGIRLVKNFLVKNKPDMFIGVWGGAQFQKLGNETSGSISLEEALNLDGSKLQELDDAWMDYMMSPEWDDLNGAQKALQQAVFDKVRGALVTLGGTTVHYTFNKRLENEWNMIIGGQWQINRTWQFRTEYGFLKTKKQLMLSLNYRFGL
jgi:hypothetical protein